MDVKVDAHLPRGRFKGPHVSDVAELLCTCGRENYLVLEQDRGFLELPVTEICTLKRWLP